MTLALVHRGDAEHGVDRLARTVAASAAVRASGAVLALPHEVVDGARAHVHFTDRLWGASPEASADAIEALAARATLTVTLHDLPQASDGARSMERRADAYRRVVRAAAAVVCTSDYERGLLARVVGADEAAACAIVPLPCERAHDAAGPVPLRREVGVLGFFYPGKGHAEAVAASAALPAPLPVVAIGRAAPGHEAELAELATHARDVGVECTSTGFLDEEALVARMRSTLVPVVAHRHVSASGSLASWIGAGRRPIVVRNAYFEEMAALRPGTTWLVDDDELPHAIAIAATDPASTHLGADASVRPDLDDVAAAYLALWGSA